LRVRILKPEGKPEDLSFRLAISIFPILHLFSLWYLYFYIHGHDNDNPLWAISTGQRTGIASNGSKVPEEVLNPEARKSNPERNMNEGAGLASL
jgi:hypothetical protein